MDKLELLHIRWAHYVVVEEKWKSRGSSRNIGIQGYFAWCRYHFEIVWFRREERLLRLLINAQSSKTDWLWREIKLNYLYVQSKDVFDSSCKHLDVLAVKAASLARSLQSGSRWKKLQLLFICTFSKIKRHEFLLKDSFRSAGCVLLRFSRINRSG